MKGLKYIAFMFLLGLVGSVNAQPWQDSLNQARKLYNAGKYKEALKYYKSADSLAPKDLNLQQEKGQTAYKAGDYATAAKSFQQLADKQTNTKKKIAATNNAGSSYMKNKDYSNAIDSFKNTLRLDPENEKARQLLAEAKRLKKQEEQQKKKNQQQKEQQENNQKDQPKNPDQKKDGQENAKDQKNQSAQNGQLQDKQTERKLDELTRQEMGTKRRVEGQKGKKGGKTARKDW